MAAIQVTMVTTGIGRNKIFQDLTVEGDKGQ